ncbi:unnamed protein product [Spirodela intermedia]|uniref:Xaa-Pro dipeptidase n=1 Tax=Spirodela intermedia TaxID=51605 RepID=A0A7I8ITS2_SPIIN|nr:unnamed protein product [Spirodela intermedia]CAA6660959.1 unnamed protein product [Spirodela intermedia]
MASSPGGSTLTPAEVRMELHAQNRGKLVRCLRQRLAESSRPVHGFVLLQGGEEQNRYCTDHAELFRQESYFAYLFGVREPGFYGAIDISSGKSILFAPRLPEEYAVWMGKIKPLAYYKICRNITWLTWFFYTDEIVEVLHNHCENPGKPLLFLLYGLNTDSGNHSKPAMIKEMEKFDTDLDVLHPVLTECRVLKSEMEIGLMQYANDISSEAHVEVMRKARVGLKEYQLESVFLHHVYMYGGCRHCSYTCVCATGENSAVLHYGHAAAPNDKTLIDGDMSLFDMGAEYHFYALNISSFAGQWNISADQLLAVLKAHDNVISCMSLVIGWIDMHKLAERTILESLKEGGLIQGDVDDMMVGRLGAVFMPHGLGHLLGIDTHDPGGYPKGLERPKEPGLKSLRTTRTLQEGLVITVEPGCYFIDALLVPAMEDPDKSKHFNRREISRFRALAASGLKAMWYDALVTAEGCRNLTNCPRKTWEIEAVMAGAPWPPPPPATLSQNGGYR